MPITQERLHALIDAGNDLTTHINGLKQIAALDGRAVQAGKLSALEAFNNLCLQIGGLNISQSELTLARESTRYRFTHKRNEREKMRKRTQRELAGYTSPTTRKPKLTAEQAAAMSDEDEGPEADMTELMVSGAGLSMEDRAKIAKEAEEAQKLIDAMGSEDDGVDDGKE